MRIDDDDLDGIERRDMLQMLFLVYLVRAFEEQVLILKDADLIHGPAHTSIGQEAVAAGVAVALRRTDLIGSTQPGAWALPGQGGRVQNAPGA